MSALDAPFAGTSPRPRAATSRRALVRPAAARLALGAVWALAAAWAVVSLSWPAGFDHGLYAWTGDVVARGGMVYRDAWDMHGPLVAYLYALPQALVGRHFWGVRVLDLAVLAVGAWGCAALAARAGTRRAPAAASWMAAVLTLAYASQTFNNTAQPDGWVALTVGALLAPVAVAARPRLRWMAVAGAAAGLFALVKPFYGVFVLVPLVVHVLRVWPDRRAALLALATAFVASLVPIALMVAWFAHRGALDALLEVHVRYTALVYNGGGLHLTERVRGVTDHFLKAKIEPVAAPAMLAGIVALWRGGRRPLLAGLLTWLALAFFVVLLQNKYYEYHWLVILPPGLVLAAHGVLAALGDRADGGDRAGGVDRAGRTLALALVAVVVARAAVRPVFYVQQWASYAAGRTGAHFYFHDFRDDGPSRPWERMRVGEYLRDRLRPGEGIAVWGTEAGILYHAASPTPFRLAAWHWPMTNAVGTPVQRAYLREYLDALRTRPPAYVVVNTALGSYDTRLGAVERYPAVAAAIADGWVEDRVVGPLHVLRRRDLARR